MKTADEIKNIARESILNEANAVQSLLQRIDDNFVHIIELLINIKGRLIIAGVGKSAIVANKMVATFNSTGLPSVFLHAGDAIHGDLGNIQAGDIVMCISKSGSTDEIEKLLPLIKNMGNIIIAMTGNLNSILAEKADFIIDVNIDQEACPYNLAPTTSSTVQLVMGDALAVSLLRCKNFSDQDFARFHPGGALGKRLSLRLSELVCDKSAPFVLSGDLISQVIIEISNKRLGATAVIDNEKIKGIITDGDLRRMLEKDINISALSARDIMSRYPKMMESNSLAYEALKIMKSNSINQLIVTKDSKYVGIVHIHDIIKQGII
jgi:arabinose-5-phosphate isomerase